MVTMKDMTTDSAEASHLEANLGVTDQLQEPVILTYSH